jgi:hypothetical protein
VDLQSECEISPYSTNGTGYAKLERKGKTIYAHRVAYEEVHGPIPEGMQVCHKCDVRNCINVEHLFLGTAKDNMQDCKAKGRIRGGRYGVYDESVNEMIRFLRTKGLTQRGIAYRIGVSQAYVSQVLRGTNAGSI